MNILDINTLTDFNKQFDVDPSGYDLEDFLSRGVGALTHKTNGVVEFIKAWGAGIDSNHDGYETEGATFTVIKVGGEYFKIVYEYYSYKGFDLEYLNIYAVNPVQRTVIDYVCHSRF